MSYITESSYTFSEKFKDLLIQWGCSTRISSFIVDFFGLFIVLVSSLIVYAILRFIIRRFLKRLVLRSASKWDDYLYENKVFTRLALLVPALMLHVALSSTIADYPRVIHGFEVILGIYSVLVIMLVANSFFNTFFFMA